MIEAFQIGVSLAVDTDEAHAALAGFGRQLSSLDQSIAQTHRRMSEMRAALSMPYDMSGGGRLPEHSNSFTRHDSRSQPGPTELETSRSPADQMTVQDVAVGSGSLEEAGRLLLRSDKRPLSGAADVSDLRSLLDVMGAADQVGVGRGLPSDSRSDTLSASEASPTWHEDFATRHVPEPAQGDVAAPGGVVGAFDFSGLLPRLGETLDELRGAGSRGDVDDASVPRTVAMPAWPFARDTEEARKQPGALTEDASPPDVAVAAGLSASSVLPFGAPDDFAQARLSGHSEPKDPVAPDPNWHSAANSLTERDAALVVPGQGMEAAFTGALSWLASSSGRSVAPTTLTGPMGRSGEQHAELRLSGEEFALREVNAHGSGRHLAAASDARGPSGGGEVAPVAAPAQPPALPFGLPLLPSALWEHGEGERQPIPPRFPRPSDGFIGMAPNNTEMAVKRDLAAPLPPVFASAAGPSSRDVEDAAGQDKGSQRGGGDERGNSATDRPIVVHTNVQIDGDIVARAVTHRMVGALNGPLAGSGGFDPRRSYTPVES